MIGHDSEVRVWLSDSECELRPVPAGELLLARQKVREKESVYGGDETARRVLLGAYMAALGIYWEDKRLFSDGEEVLETLTAEEILSVLEEYGELSLEGSSKSEETSREETAEEAEGNPKALARYGEGKRTIVTGNKESGSHAENAVYTIREDPRLYRKQDGYAAVSGFFERDCRRYDGAFIRY